MPDKERDISITPTHTIDDAGLQEGTNYLLAIGIDKYKHCTPLNNAVRDAQGVITVLSELYHFEPAHITRLFDEEATKNNIINAFKLHKNKITDQDSLIVYFSGHGWYDEDEEEGFWIPVDAIYKANEEHSGDYIANFRIRNLIKSIKSRHTFLVSDSCFSGSLFGSSRDLNAQWTEALEKIPSRWGLSSGMNKPVSDGGLGENSPFAKYFIKILRENKEDKIIISDFINRICKAVPNNSNGKQHPIGNRIMDAGDEGLGQFVFRLKQDEEKAWQAAQVLNTSKSYKEFSYRFPSGKYHSEAQQKLQEIESIDLEKRKQDYINFFKLLYRDLQIDADERSYLDREKNRLQLSDGVVTEIENATIKSIQSEIKVSSQKQGEKEEAKQNKEEIRIWQVAQSTDTIEGYQQYLSDSTLLKFKLDAGEAIQNFKLEEEESLWIAAQEKNTITAYQNIYIRKTALGKYTIEANERIEAIRHKNALAKKEKKEQNKATPVVSTVSTSKVKESKKEEKPSFIKMVKVDGGTFEMGKSSSSSEFVHKVQLDAFLIGKYPVTQKQWKAIMKSNPSLIQNDKAPIESINWFDAVEFCNKLSEKEGLKPFYKIEKDPHQKSQKYWVVTYNKVANGYRLPTEAEWEFAAKGGIKSKGFIYSGSDNWEEVGCIKAGFWAAAVAEVKPVGQKKPNELGIYDMSGNMEEWCNDWFEESYYHSSPKKNPMGLQFGSKRVVRSGTGKTNSQVTHRASHEPKHTLLHLGFRVARNDV